MDNTSLNTNCNARPGFIEAQTGLNCEVSSYTSRWVFSPLCVSISHVTVWDIQGLTLPPNEYQ